MEEIKHLKVIHDANFGSNPIGPIMLLNKISQFYLDDVFSNVAVASLISCTILATFASASANLLNSKILAEYNASDATNKFSKFEFRV